MTCAFCGSRNNEGEHRCRKCGRRPDDGLGGDPSQYRTTGQLAMKPTPLAVEPERRQSSGRPFQASLFPSTKVIPFEAYAPVEPPAPPPQRQRSASSTTKPKTRRGPRVPEGQGQLDFLASAPLKPKTLGTTVEAVIFCDAPVASKLHRAVAAALDWSLVLIAYGLFLAVSRYIDGSIALDNQSSVAVHGGVLLLFGFSYGLMWALAGAETIGMQWTGLKLLTFDGFPPDKRQRIIRFMGSCLGLCTLIGLAWSLVDEEGLGWQDHMSKTFPTPAAAENRILVQR